MLDTAAVNEQPVMGPLQNPAGSGVEDSSNVVAENQDFGTALNDPSEAVAEQPADTTADDTWAGRFLRKALDRGDLSEGNRVAAQTNPGVLAALTSELESGGEAAGQSLLDALFLTGDNATPRTILSELGAEGASATALLDREFASDDPNALAYETLIESLRFQQITAEEFSAFTSDETFLAYSTAILTNSFASPEEISTQFSLLVGEGQANVRAGWDRVINPEIAVDQLITNAFQEQFSKTYLDQVHDEYSTPEQAIQSWQAIGLITPQEAFAVDREAVQTYIDGNDPLSASVIGEPAFARLEIAMEHDANNRTALEALGDQGSVALAVLDREFASNNPNVPTFNYLLNEVGANRISAEEFSVLVLDPTYDAQLKAVLSSTDPTVDRALALEVLTGVAQDNIRAGWTRALNPEQDPFTTIANARLERVEASFDALVEQPFSTPTQAIQRWENLGVLSPLGASTIDRDQVQRYLDGDMTLEALELDQLNPRLQDHTRLLALGEDGEFASELLSAQFYRNPAVADANTFLVDTFNNFQLSTNEFATLVNDQSVIEALTPIIAANDVGSANLLVSHAVNNLREDKAPLAANADVAAAIESEQERLAGLSLGDQLAGPFSTVQQALNVWTTPGVDLLTPEQRSLIEANPGTMAELEAIIESGSGQVTINSEGQLELEQIISDAAADPAAALAEPIDLYDGPTAEQAASLNYYSGGHGNGYIEASINALTARNPGLELTYNPAQQDYQFQLNGTGITDSDYLNDIIDRFNPNVLPNGPLESNLGDNLGGTGEGVYHGFAADRRRTGRSGVSTTFADRYYAIDIQPYELGITSELNEVPEDDRSTAAERKTREAFMNAIGVEDYTHQSRATPGLNRFYDLATENQTQVIDQRGLGFAQNLESGGDENLLDGTTTLAVGVDNAQIYNQVSDIGATNVLGINSQNINVNTGIGDANVSLVNTGNSTVDSKTGNVEFTLIDTNDITLNDLGRNTIQEDDTVSLVTIGTNRNVALNLVGGANSAQQLGNLEGLHIKSEGQEVDQTDIALLGGTNTSGLTIQLEDENSGLSVQEGAELSNATLTAGDGDNLVESGGTISNVNISTGGGDDAVNIGSLPTNENELESTPESNNIHVDTGSGDDTITVSGINSTSVFDGANGNDEIVLDGEFDQTNVFAGKGNDRITVAENTSGNLNLNDRRPGESGRSWQWKGSDNIHENDIVILEGEGWELRENANGEEEITRVGADGEPQGVLINTSQVDSENLEQIVQIANGVEDALKQTDPEVRNRLGGFSTIGTIATVVGSIAGTVATAGIGGPVFAAIVTGAAATSASYELVDGAAHGTLSPSQLLRIGVGIADTLGASKLITSGADTLLDVNDGNSFGAALNGLTFGGELLQSITPDIYIESEDITIPNPADPVIDEFVGNGRRALQGINHAANGEPFSAAVDVFAPVSAITGSEILELASSQHGINIAQVLDSDFQDSDAILQATNVFDLGAIDDVFSHFINAATSNNDLDLAENLFLGAHSLVTQTDAKPNTDQENQLPEFEIQSPLDLQTEPEINTDTPIEFSELEIER